MVLLLPDQVRLVQASADARPYVYLQPTFVSTGQNDRVEVISGMTLSLRRDGGEEVGFTWDEVGRLEFDPADDSLSYVYLADAAPLLVAPDTAENPLALFLGPPGWDFEPGRYEARLVGERVVASDRIEATFSITLTVADVELLSGSPGDRFLAVPIGVGG